MTRETAMKAIRLIEKIDGLENALYEFDNYINDSDLGVYLNADEIYKMKRVIEDKLFSLNERLKEL